VSTSALICLDNPALFLAFRPSENGVLTPLTSALVPERELSPETQSRCGPPPGRTQLLERLSALCVYLGRACSLAGDIGRQPSLVLSGIAKGEVAGWTGECRPLVAYAQRRGDRIFSVGGDGGRGSQLSLETSKGNVVDTIEDIAVLGALLVFSSLSLAVIVLMY